VQNSCNLTHVVLINFCMRMVDFDFYFVKDTFSTNEKPTVRGVSTPNDSGSAINFYAQVWGFIESSEETRITREDGVFGVFDVDVFHALNIHGFDGSG